MQLYLSTVVLVLGAVGTRFRAALEKAVPVGYQDENGFHKGTEPKKKDPSWPPLW